ncbi:MAG: hypothetical protein SH856_01710 [Flavobacteriales bacterium]|nr:hypothetical protein [Flavobacteriales bacterium]
MKYDPEDIESLMMNKGFDELYPEEKNFVLQHLEDEDEYESIRKTLFEVQLDSRNNKWLEPDASIRKNLMAQFSTEHKRGFFIWLNSLFAMPERSWGMRPAYVLVIASVVIVAGVLFFMNQSGNQSLIAENKVSKQTQKEEDKTIQPNTTTIENADIVQDTAQIKFTPPELAEDERGIDMIAEKEDLSKMEASGSANEQLVFRAEEAAPTFSGSAFELKTLEAPSVNDDAVGFYTFSHGGTDVISDSVTLINSEISNNTALNSYTPASTDVVTIESGKVRSAGAFKGVAEKNKTSVTSTAADTKDLLDLLFTAL